MTSDEKLEKLYLGIINGEELTAKQLASYGLTYTDINKLIQVETIERVKKGLYSLKNVDGLYNYGKKLLSVKEEEKATKCFEKCYELDPQHLETCLQLFLRSIKSKNYEMSFKLLEVFLNSENIYYKTDANYFLLLLSTITEVPEGMRQISKNISHKDIEVLSDDNRYLNTQEQNDIRAIVIQKKFTYAFRKTKDLTAQYKRIPLQDFIVKTLMTQAVETDVKNKKAIIEMIKKDNYEGIIDNLSNLQKQINLSILEKYILELSYRIIEIRDTKKIPKKQTLHFKTVFEAIDYKDYEAALALSTEYNNRAGINNDSNIINLLLTKICALIKEYSFEQFTKEQTYEEELVIDSHSSMTSVKSLLLNNDCDRAFKELKNYMKSIGKSQYEILIILLIKISLKEKDMTFTKPMETLSLISNEKFTFDIHGYIKDFYMCISKKEYECAKIYLEIISKSSDFGLENLSVKHFYHVLDVLEREQNKDTDNTQIDKTGSIIENNIVYSNSKNDKSNIKKINSPKVSSTQENKEKEIEFLSAKHEELLKQGDIIILKPMPKNRINMLLRLTKNYSDMRAFVIEDSGKTQIVLKYAPFIDEKIDARDLMAAGNEAYKKGDFEKSIEIYKKLLQFLVCPKSYNYLKLGMAYLRNFSFKRATKCLTVANYLSKKEESPIDVTDTLLRLQGVITDEETKPKFKMNMEDFNFDELNNHYGIDNIEGINSLIVYSGMDLESACKSLKFTPEETDIVKLIYAREYYASKDFVKGDSFLRSYEKSKNKTKKSISIYNQIRKNRNFYQNRNRGNIQFSLSALPEPKCK